MEINHNLKKAKYYNDLTEYERDVLEEFDKLIKRIGRSYSYYYCEHTEGLGGVCIVKKDGVWAAYVDERGSFHGYTEYSDVYDMAIDLFEGRPLDETVYCLNNFPKKEEFNKKQK